MRGSWHSAAYMSTVRLPHNPPQRRCAAKASCATSSWGNRVAPRCACRVPADGARVFVVEVCAGLDEKLEHTLATAEHSTYERRPPAYSMAGATQSATSRDPTSQRAPAPRDERGMWIAAPEQTSDRH